MPRLQLDHAQSTHIASRPPLAPDPSPIPPARDADARLYRRAERSTAITARPQLPRTPSVHRNLRIYRNLLLSRLSRNTKQTRSATPHGRENLCSYFLSPLLASRTPPSGGSDTGVPVPGDGDGPFARKIRPWTVRPSAHDAACRAPPLERRDAEY